MVAAPPTRSQIRQHLQGGCDVLVIGGGITGAGVALDAVTRGYRVALVDRGDFAGGTSSRSTKLVHGGLRYLPQGRLGLVREALIERERLRRLAPHLVRPLGFLVPLYAETARPLGLGIPALLRPLAPLALRTGLWGYDVLARTDLVHRRLRPADAAALVPAVRVEGLRAAFLYHDAQTDDLLLTLAVLATARRFGALTLNHSEVTAVAMGSPARVRILDRLDGTTYEVTARHVVNAAGIWAEEVAGLAGAVPFRIERSKGVHLVLDGADLFGATALVIPETDDGRLAFAIPWYGRVLLGTTDDSYAGDADAPRATAAEARYLLDHLNRYLRISLPRQAVVSAFAGLRPLVQRGAARSAELSRSHEVVQHASGLVSIVGGKLTTYRRMAEDTVDLLVRRDGRRLPCRTATLPLDDREPAVQALIASEPALARPLVPGLPVRAADVVYACRAEQCLHVVDFMFSRSHLAVLDRDHGLGCVEGVARLMAGELGWSTAEVAAQVRRYRERVALETAFLADL
ncbi:MAG: glycerol-3-phosphate dehydrogenase/oxidase [Armatimonadota bacterium]|nr:glycerol-3-phosphate dehydrogenase/oxidase [Armatimonadota bacterium]MDR7450322.1 glycerol-3-phosphate dehydrogenase/oxidase [Armatimonadota bacterium]MDR7467095.1 glycerol-3-phosphate dehydrogenase/oxidase [Armatimonadota bacterium]MDR7493363.1 glycerol-3-phosphate dehydrogenase/oxidase [Armatimonadota bacterium]MDR7499371.1 glycerol-3-phosphate dehydrogenase/oxidase [Armatimonadota bacterium]